MDDLKEVLWCVADIEVSSANTEVCSCQKSGINKSAINTKNRDDINKSAMLQGA
jgi:uncharacterized protein YqkB